MAKNLTLLILLSGCAWQDIKKKKVLVWPILMAGGIGICFELLQQFNENKSLGLEGSDLAEISLRLAAGVLPGVVLLLAGKWSGGQIGTGDGLLVMIIGIYLGFWKTMIILFYASTAAGLVGLFLLLILKKNSKYEIPFIPFLLAVFTVRLMVEI